MSSQHLRNLKFKIYYNRNYRLIIFTKSSFEIVVGKGKSNFKPSKVNLGVW